MFATCRLFFSSSRQVGYFKIPWIYRKVGRQVGLENFQYFGQVSLKIIENMNFLVGRQVGFSQKVYQKKQVGRQVSQVASKHWVTYPLEKLESSQQLRSCDSTLLLSLISRPRAVRTPAALGDDCSGLCGGASLCGRRIRLLSFGEQKRPSS